MKRGREEQICVNCGDYECETCSEYFIVYVLLPQHCGNLSCPHCRGMVEHDCENTTCGATCYVCGGDTYWDDSHCVAGNKYTAQNHPCARKDSHECGRFDFCILCGDCQCFEGNKCLKSEGF